jgi:predicted Zn-dependent protease
MGLYRIRNGEIVGSVKKSRLVGNLLEILKNIDMVSKERLLVDGWVYKWGDYHTVPILRSKARVLPIN